MKNFSRCTLRLVLVLTVMFIFATVWAQHPVNKPKAVNSTTNAKNAANNQKPKTGSVAAQPVKKKVPEDPYQVFLKELRKPIPDVKVIREKISLVPKEKLSIRDTANANAFYNAIKSRNNDILWIMLDHGYSVSIIDTLNQTVLHKAAQTNDYEVYDYLKRRGAAVYVNEKDINGKYAYELFQGFTHWNDLKIYSKNHFKGSSIPSSPLSYKEIYAMLAKQAKMFFFASAMQGQYVQDANDVFVAACKVDDKIPISTIKANSIGGDFITFDSDALFTVDFKVILPIGGEITTHALTLWGKTFLNCRILLLDKGVLEIPMDNINDSIKETQTNNKQFSAVATAGGGAMKVTSQGKPKEDNSSVTAVSGGKVNATSPGKLKEDNTTVTTVSGGKVIVRNQADPEEDNTNVLYYIATINYLIIGTAGEHCRLILNEYANATLYLSKEDALKYGLIEVKDGVTINTAKPGTNVKVGTKDSWITSFELTDN